MHQDKQAKGGKMKQTKTFLVLNTKTPGRRNEASPRDARPMNDDTCRKSRTEPPPRHLMHRLISAAHLPKKICI
jgi:hypothetical protein